MRDIVILGSGGLAKEVYSIIKTINILEPTWNVLGFTSNDDLHKTIIDGYLIIGDNSYLDTYKGEIDIVIAIGDSRFRQSLYNQLRARDNIYFPNIIHPNSLYDPKNINIGTGNIIASNVIISPDVKIEKFNILNMGSIIAHDSIILSYCTLNPASNISGDVMIGNHCTIGSNAVIHQGVNIAENTILGMGSVLTKDTIANSTYFGNPAKRIG